MKPADCNLLTNCSKSVKPTINLQQVCGVSGCVGAKLPVKFNFLALSCAFSPNISVFLYVGRHKMHNFS